MHKVCDRKTLKVIVEMFTGPCHLRTHLHTLGKVPEPDCRKCGMEEETAHHIVCEYPAIKSIRVRLYEKQLPPIRRGHGGATLKNSSVCIGDWSTTLGNQGGTMGQA